VAKQSWPTASGGTNGKLGAPEGWYKTLGPKTLADKEDAFTINKRSEKSFLENGIYYQGTIAVWNKKGYGSHLGPYTEPVYGYDPKYAAQRRQAHDEMSVQ